jgi:hypothetical protein
MNLAKQDIDKSLHGNRIPCKAEILEQLSEGPKKAHELLPGRPAGWVSIFLAELEREGRVKYILKRLSGGKKIAHWVAK